MPLRFEPGADTGGSGGLAGAFSRGARENRAHQVVCLDVPPIGSTWYI